MLQIRKMIYFFDCAMVYDFDIVVELFIFFGIILVTVNSRYNTAERLISE